MALRVLSLCDGMGTGKLAFNELGIETEYWAVEIDQYARTLCDFNLNVIRPCNDVLDITPRQIFMDWPPFDYVLFGFTCKSLSRQSNGENLDGSSKILFDCMNILANVKFRNPISQFLIENVYSMTNEMKKTISGIVTVNYNSIDSGMLSGQARKRLYWTNWENRIIQHFANIKREDIQANNILEDDAKELKAWSQSSRYKDKNGKVFQKPGPGLKRFVESRFRTDGKANTLVTGRGCKGQSTKNIVITKDGRERDLTVRECARLQTIPESYLFESNGSLIIPENQAYNCLGNGWTLEVIKELIRASL